jgi:hypothetical protein
MTGVIPIKQTITLQHTVTYHISQGSTIKHTIYLGQQILTYKNIPKITFKHGMFKCGFLVKWYV